MRHFAAFSLFLVMVALSGCDKLKGLADFTFSVSNRTPNRVMFYVNGVEQGEIPANKPQTFVVKLKVLNNGGYVGSSASAYVTIVGRDQVTMRLSQQLSVTVYEDRPENVEFTTSDFR